MPQAGSPKLLSSGDQSSRHLRTAEEALDARGRIALLPRECTRFTRECARGLHTNVAAGFRRFFGRIFFSAVQGRGGQARFCSSESRPEIVRYARKIAFC